jgi:hypothetical protein
MTWAKLPTQYAVENRHLSDAAFRAHTEGLCAVMDRETGGYLTDREVVRFMEGEHTAEGIAELVACGYWRKVAGGYVVVEHMQHQPEPDLIRKRREASAERVRKHRRKQAGLPADAPDVTALRDALSESNLNEPNNAVRETNHESDAWLEERGA